MVATQNALKNSIIARQNSKMLRSKLKNNFEPIMTPSY
jgi:hypothetical protein